MTYDSTNDPVVMESIESDQAESLAIGQELQAQQEALLAGKYKNAQDLEAAYIELQKKLGSGERQTQETEEKAEAPADPGVDILWKINNEFAENNGQISEATLKEVESMSSKELLEAYFRYQDTVDQNPAPQSVELSDAQVSDVQNYVGGAEKYQELVSWAADNFSEEEITAFDSVVETGNVPAIKLALQSLQYRYQDKMGYEGNMLQGKAAESRDVFRSQAELVRAMSDPRYDQDPAYRQDIMNKIERSGLSF